MSSLADMNFRSLYRHGFARVAACTTRTTLADPAANAEAILAMARSCDEQSVALTVFPELCISGYAIGDLLQQTVVLDAVEAAIDTIVDASASLLPLLLVGAPLRHQGALYNCALAIHRGRVLGVVPKIHLPNYREFYETRHFVSGDGQTGGAISIGRHTVPFGTDLLFAASDLRDFIVHAEICEDIWVPNPPSGEAAVAGATVLANLSASNITIGKAETRRLLCQSQSARCVAVYLYAAAGAGESTTDLAWDGQASVFENGVTLTETERFPSDGQAAIADIDLDLLRQERLRMGSFDTNRRRARGTWRTIGFSIDPPAGDLGPRRRIERFPFVPSDVERLEQAC
jgi:NAD+ synthase (glutamine-hydrolysing)